MAAILVSIVLVLMGEAVQARWLQQPPPAVPGRIPDPGQIDTPRSRDVFDQGACPGTKDPACESTVLVSPPRGGVSARTLTHKHSKAALKAFNRAHRAWKKGQSDRVLRYLVEALHLDPDFMEARADLGAVYAQANRPEDALEQYDQALAVEPNLALLHSNKAAALVMLSRWEEAERAARHAVQLDPESINANYMLGIAMMKQGKFTAETAARLAIAAKTHPRARAFLAELQTAFEAQAGR
jgi:tetratricopeptide (TPR) repeat protein